MNYVGIDYHKKYRVVTAVDEKSQMIRTTRLDNKHAKIKTNTIAAHTTSISLIVQAFRD